MPDPREKKEVIIRNRLLSELLQLTTARTPWALTYDEARFCSKRADSQLTGGFSTGVRSENFTCLNRKPSSWQPTTYLIVCGGSVCSQFLGCRRTVHSHIRLVKVSFACMQDSLVLWYNRGWAAISGHSTST